MHIDDILSKLDIKSKNNEGYMAICPSHEDNNASLSISLDTNTDNVLVKCHAGCDTNDVLNKIGYSMKDLFPNNKKDNDMSTSTKNKTITAIYDYTDDKGNLLYQRLRYENPKNFKVRQPDKNKPDMWIWNLKGINETLFKLLELLHAVNLGSVVYLVEGEKDVNSLINFGFTATTSGNAQSWKKEYAKHFKDADVVILPDNDEPGRKYANQAAKSLLNIAKSIKVLDLPELKNKGDVTDWIEAGGDKETLLNLVDMSPIWEQQNDTTQKIERTLDDTLNDSGNAKMLNKYCCNTIRYNLNSGDWFIWNGIYWAIDHKRSIYQTVEKALDTWYENLKERPYPDQTKIITHVKNSKNTGKIESMLKYAQSLPGIAVLQKELDSNLYLLTCKNGTLNLKTKKLQKQRKDDLITKRVNYEYNQSAKCPIWEQTLNEIFCNDLELTNWFQKVLGYAITGDTSEQVFFLLYGTGANGKSTILNVIKELFADYHKSIQTDTLMESNKTGSEASPDLARLAGARIVSAIETKETRSLAEGLIKQITGNDTICARHLYQDSFEYTPKFKLFLATNHQPRISGQDHGIWRRIIQIPFNARFEGSHIDKHLDTKLRNEYEGILNWIVEGCYKWLSEGLGTCKTVDNSISQYKSESDKLNDFKLKCCIVKKGESIGSTLLYKAYKEYEFQQCNNRPMSQRTFVKYLTDSGLVKIHNRDGNIIDGITLKESCIVNDVNDNQDYGKVLHEDIIEKVSRNPINPSHASHNNNLHIQDIDNMHQTHKSDQLFTGDGPDLKNVVFNSADISKDTSKDIDTNNLVPMKTNHQGGKIKVGELI